MKMIPSFFGIKARPFWLTLLLLAAVSVGLRWHGGLAPQGVAAQGTVSVVNAASFASDRTVTPDCIVAAFGTFNTQNNQIYSASTQPLPTTLGGVTVRVNNVVASLFFVAPSQINFIIPSGIQDGTATISVTNANNTTSTGTFPVVRAAAGIFTAKSTGQGAPAAQTTFDAVTYQSVADAQGNEVPVNPGTRDRKNVLVLYGTGIRNGAAGSVTVKFQGVPAEVLYAGPVPGLAGLDQINVYIPPELAGLGSLNVVVRAGNRDANTVKVRIGGDTPLVRASAVSFGQSVNGTLAIDDQVQLGADSKTYFFDAYEFTTTTNNTSVAIDLRSSNFDTTVLLYRVDGTTLNLIAADDQSGSYGAKQGTNNNNSLLMSVLQTPARYVVFATSADPEPNAIGNYTIRVTNNIAQPITFGQTINGTLTTNSLKTSADTYLDVYWFSGAQGDNARINMNSTALNSFLILHRNDGDPYVTFDDNTGGGNNAQITYRLAAAGIYLIIATPLDPNITGAYTVSLNRATAFGGEAGTEASPSLKAPGRELRDERGLPTQPSIERYGTRHIVER